MTSRSETALRSRLPAISMLYKQLVILPFVFSPTAAPAHMETVLSIVPLLEPQIPPPTLSEDIFPEKKQSLIVPELLPQIPPAVLPETTALSTAQFSIVPPSLTAQMPPLTVPFAKDESASLMLLIVPPFIYPNSPARSAPDVFSPDIV